MEKIMFIILAIYLVVISIVAIAVTCYDKQCAKKGKWRVKEATLLLISALGGSVAMYITMKKIRHKTQHKKFMIGIPAIMVAQVALIVVLVVIF